MYLGISIATARVGLGLGEMLPTWKYINAVNIDGNGHVSHIASFIASGNFLDRKQCISLSLGTVCYWIVDSSTLDLRKGKTCGHRLVRECIIALCVLHNHPLVLQFYNDKHHLGWTWYSGTLTTCSIEDVFSAVSGELELTLFFSFGSAR